MSLLDCTIRDGGYTNNWEFDDAFVVDLYHKLNKIPQYEYQEIGYYNENGNGSTSYWYLDNDRINSLFNIVKDRLKLSVMVNYSSSDVTVSAEESLIDLIRVCFHKKDLHQVFPFLEHVKSLGYTVAANAMAFEYFDDNDLRFLVDECRRVNVDYLYIADSHGSIYPQYLLDKIGVIQLYGGHSGLKIGVHLHDNLSLAMASYLKARNRVDIIDTTLCGLGRGAGNLKTEVVVAHLLKEKQLMDDTILRDLICLIDKTSCAGDPRVSYLISGYFSVHPNYVTHMLKSGVGVMDIWHKCQWIKSHGFGKTFDVKKLKIPLSVEQ